MRRAQVLVMMLMLAVLSAACGGGGGTSTEDRPLGLDSDEAAAPTLEAVIPTPPPTPTPTPTPEPFVYVVKEGDTLGSIATEFGTSLDAIIALNENELENPNILSIGQHIEIPQTVPVVRNDDGTVRPGDRTHIVVAGETLLGIALQYNKTLDELLLANEITAANLLQIGQELIIPADDEVTAP